MADCNKLFQEYWKSISVTKAKKDKMKSSKKALRDRIVNHFKKEHPDYYPKFYIQGSSKMKTAIRTKDDICDLDDGFGMQSMGILTQNQNIVRNV